MWPERLMTEGAAWSDTVPLNSHQKGENGILSEEKYIYNDVGLLPIQEKCYIHLVARIWVVFNLKDTYE